MSEAPFKVYVWPQRVLVLGPGFASIRHRHHAAQFAFGLDGPVIFEAPQTGLQRSEMLLISPNAPHAHPAFGPLGFLYLEPESVEWASFAGRGQENFVHLPFSERQRSVARCAAAGDGAAASSLVDNLIGKSPSSALPDDALVSQTIANIRRSLDAPIKVAALAKAVHRSPSRLAHRFREATGVSMRRYVLWCRLRAALDAALRGSSLTAAAHLAGFADSAHLSRTFRAMFGVAPSFFFKPGLASITFCGIGAST
ncbi:MAG TPA: AraC family transcriptional regulator [Terracidiphilus sp.]|nr:AraC family transcriptional regulator [Terracidiphilus sp.]